MPAQPFRGLINGLSSVALKRCELRQRPIELASNLELACADAIEPDGDRAELTHLLRDDIAALPVAASHGTFEHPVDIG